MGGGGGGGGGSHDALPSSRKNPPSQSSFTFPVQMSVGSGAQDKMETWAQISDCC